MPSQLELLKESLPPLEAKFGSDNPFVRGLKAQIASYEKPPAENPVEMYSAGMRPRKRESEEEAILAEHLRRLKARQSLKARQAQTPASSPSQSSTPETTASTSSAKPSTST